MMAVRRRLTAHLATLPRDERIAVLGPLCRGFADDLAPAR
jgi:hypothetical protein